MGQSSVGGVVAEVIDPATRGSLRVAPRVVERIAAYVTASVPGVGSSDRLPRAQATLARAGGAALTGGGRVSVTVDVAITWPQPAAEVATHVRSAVASAVEGLTPFTADHVDVRVKAVVGPVASERVQ